MKKHLILSAFLIFSLGCGKEKDVIPTATQMESIATAAGMLARNLAFESDNANWSQAPDQAQLEAIEQLAKENVIIWPTFFRAAADSAMKLEQIDMQEARDAIQSDML